MSRLLQKWFSSCMSCCCCTFYSLFSSKEHKPLFLEQLYVCLKNERVMLNVNVVAPPLLIGLEGWSHASQVETKQCVCDWQVGHRCAPGPVISYWHHIYKLITYIWSNILQHADYDFNVVVWNKWWTKTTDALLKQLLVHTQTCIYQTAVQTWTGDVTALSGLGGRHFNVSLTLGLWLGRQCVYRKCQDGGLQSLRRALPASITSKPFYEKCFLNITGTVPSSVPECYNIYPTRIIKWLILRLKPVWIRKSGVFQSPRHLSQAGVQM